MAFLHLDNHVTLHYLNGLLFKLKFYVLAHVYAVLYCSLSVPAYSIMFSLFVWCYTDPSPVTARYSGDNSFRSVQHI